MEAFITEVMSVQRVEEIIVHFYEFALENEEKKYEEIAPLYWQLKKANDYMVMSFNQHTIMTFEPIKHFLHYVPTRYQYRAIQEDYQFERALLERLVKESLLVTGQRKLHLKRVKDSLQYRQAISVGEITIYPALSLHVNIVESYISVGFDLAHKFEYTYTIQQMFDRHEDVRPGMRLVHSDQHNHYEYTLQEVAPYSPLDYCPRLQKSIYQYYIEKGNDKFASTLRETTKVIYVSTHHGLSLSYPATLLKPLCSFETMRPTETRGVMEKLKLTPDERMRKILGQMLPLLSVYPYLKFPRNAFVIQENRYSLLHLSPPKIQFDQAYTRPLHGLKEGKVFKGQNITVSIFLDEHFAEKHYISKSIIFRFIKVLQNIARKHGVKVDFSSAPKEVKGQFDDVFFQNFRWEAAELERIFKGTTVLAFITEEHLAQVPYNIYQQFKQQFGGVWDISSQMITEHTVGKFVTLLKRHNKLAFDFSNMDELEEVTKLVKNSDFSYVIYNILLGLYVKSGVQPWVLAHRTHAHCFIGLDVSHENGRSAAGIINVMNCHGHLLQQSAVNGVLEGEKIDNALITKIIEEILAKYQAQNGILPKHITIHRDGRWRESTESVAQLLNAYGVTFDIVEIIKKPNRRIAFLDLQQGNGQGKFMTKQGTYYVRGKEAYLCATDPRENIGMAQPLKIHQITSSQSFQQIIEDVYHLSFMHIHSLNKTRLPATIHYADLSSLAYQRGQISTRATSQTFLPFV